MNKFFAIALLGVAGFGIAAALPAPVDVPVPARAADEVLEQSMETLNGGLKGLLKGGISAETKDKSLETLVRMQSAIVAAKSEKPHDLSAEELVGYRAMMADMLGLTCKIEVATLQGKFDDANKLVKDELTRFKKEGHDKYQKEEEEHGEHKK
ncbi:MAG: cytochrome b562 [Planctomycetota bacterium]|nr:cytochrome b562 [Planctomycetota bacterium]